MGNRPLVYMAAPLSGDIPGNLRRAKLWLAWLMREVPEVCFVAPWITAVEAGADDSDPAARERGLLDAEAVIARCDGIVLVGERVSSGMKREWDCALDHRLNTCRLTDAGWSEPPAEERLTFGMRLTLLSANLPGWAVRE